MPPNRLRLGQPELHFAAAHGSFYVPFGRPLIACPRSSLHLYGFVSGSGLDDHLAAKAENQHLAAGRPDCNGLSIVYPRDRDADAVEILGLTEPLSRQFGQKHPCSLGSAEFSDRRTAAPNRRAGFPQCERTIGQLTVLLDIRFSGSRAGRLHGPGREQRRSVLAD